MHPEKTRSDFWFLLPLFFGLIGGFIAYFVLRQDDPKKAKNNIYLALILILRDFLLIAAISMNFPELEQGFNINV